MTNDIFFYIIQNLVKKRIEEDNKCFSKLESWEVKIIQCEECQF